MVLVEEKHILSIKHKFHLPPNWGTLVRFTPLGKKQISFTLEC